MWPIARVFFPEHDGFTIDQEQIKDKNCLDSFTYFVCHKSGSSRFCSLTWTTPTKIAISEADRFSKRHIKEARSAPTLYRLHAVGTRLGIYVLVASDSQHGVVHSPDILLFFGREDSLNWNSDLLEPLGFHHLVSHFRNARSSVHRTAHDWEPDLTSVYITSLPSQISFGCAEQKRDCSFDRVANFQQSHVKDTQVQCHDLESLTV